MKDDEAYKNLRQTMEANEGFVKAFTKKHPQFYGKPFLDEKEGEAFLEALHKEYKLHPECIDPLVDVRINLGEDIFIAPWENVVIHEVLHYMPAIMHYNEYFEVKYVLEGRCSYYFENKVLHLKKGDLIIVPPKIRQCMVIEEDCRVYNILIRASTFDTVFLNLLNKDDFLADFFSRALYGSPAAYILWHCENNKNLEKLIKRCYFEFYADLPYKNRMVDILLTEMFVELLRYELQTGALPEIPALSLTETVQVVLKYLQNHCSDASLSRAAMLCNYSERQLTRILQAELGCSFTRLRQQIRLNKACALLKNPGLGLKEIAASLGFVNESYFCKVFRKEYMITPMEYREKQMHTYE